MVFVDFALLPPEVISGQIHAGPGAESMRAAAAAWQVLAGELQSTAASYGSVIAELVSESWTGMSSVLMAAAAAPYVEWISATAAQAEETASQALAAASAYEAALAATVPPAIVAANRVRLAALLATNIFGQNGAAIAATEADYGQMWSQNVAAMFAYAASSEAAGELTLFTGPPKITGDTGGASQATAAASSPTSTVSSWLQQIERYIDSLVLGYDKFWEGLITGVTGSSEVAPLYESLYATLNGISSQARWLNVTNSTVGVGILEWKNFFVYKAGIAEIPRSALGAGLGSPGRVAPFGSVRPVSASLASAPTVGKLSVPPSWATATPAIRLASTALPATSIAAAPASELLSGLVNEGTLGSFAGGALGNSRSRVVSSTGIQTRAISGERLQGPVKLDSVIAQLQEQPDMVQHWSVDEAGLDELLAKLRTTPGVHAVHVTDDQVSDGVRPQLG